MFWPNFSSNPTPKGSLAEYNSPEVLEIRSELPAKEKEEE